MDKNDPSNEPDIACGGPYGEFVADVQGKVAEIKLSPRTIGWAEKVRRDPEAGECEVGGVSENRFPVDFRVYNWDGEWHGWDFDLEATKANEVAYLSRRLQRMLSKGRPHECKLIDPDKISELPNRQQRRHAQRQLVKQQRRGDFCHPKAVESLAEAA